MDEIVSSTKLLEQVHEALPLALKCTSKEDGVRPCIEDVVKEMFDIWSSSISVLKTGGKRNNCCYGVACVREVSLVGMNGSSWS